MTSGFPHVVKQPQTWCCDKKTSSIQHCYRVINRLFLGLV